MSYEEEVKECPNCPVKGYGPDMERHIFRCTHSIPMSYNTKKMEPKKEM